MKRVAIREFQPFLMCVFSGRVEFRFFGWSPVPGKSCLASARYTKCLYSQRASGSVFSPSWAPSLVVAAAETSR